MKKVLLPLSIFFSSLLIALYNIGGFPKMVGDEGIYVSQAYWLTHLGKLGPYTYWYDHFPLGWAQIGLWQLLVGTTPLFNSTVLSARIFMGIILASTTTLLYFLVHKLSKSTFFGIIASTSYITSALTLTFGRMVLLDNIAIFWFLLSLVLLLSHPSKIKNLTISSLALALAILSKESLLFFLPPYLYLVSHLNKNNIFKKYALTINYLTIFFSLAFFPLLAILKSELLPRLGQVSLLDTITFQVNRGTQLPFWNPTSHFSQMLHVWLTIDPILIILGSITTMIVLLSKVDVVQKIITSFTLFFLLFLVRGGQIYDFYIIPILPLMACNLALFLNHYTHQLKLRFLPILFLITLYSYSISSNAYIFLGNATKHQLEAIKYVSNLPNSSHITANNYAYLDLWLNHHKIDWYSKIESDPPVRHAYQENLAEKYILIDETIGREVSNGYLPFIKNDLLDSQKIIDFGPQLGPGELSLIKPYSTDSSILFKINQPALSPKEIISLTNLTFSSINELKALNPYGILITNRNFTNSKDLESKLNLLKQVLPNTLIFVRQDSEGNNTIPWINTESRSFFKSNQEASNSSTTKALALQKLGFNGAIVATSQDQDHYLTDIISSSNAIFTSLVKYQGNISNSIPNLFLDDQNDIPAIENQGYRGQLFLLKELP